LTSFNLGAQLCSSLLSWRPPAPERIDEVLVKKAVLSTGRRLAAVRDDEQQIVEHSGIRALFSGGARRRRRRTPDDDASS
jgi:hypothetical protein